MAKLKKPLWRRIVLSLLIVALAGYTAAVAVIFFAQRSYQYYPAGDGLARPAAGLPVEVTHITTADGEILTAWYMPAKPGRPTLLLFNGNGASLAYEEPRQRLVAAAGVGFLAIGYRGYDGSTGRPTEAGLHKDALAAYDWLAARVPPSDIVIEGFSLGTGVAVRLASEKPARALVLEAPYTSAADLAQRTFPWAPVRLLMLDQFRSRDVIGKVTMPVLIVHGEADEVIPVAMGEQLFSMAREPKTFVRVPEADHNGLVRYGLYDHVWRFLGLRME